VSFFYGKREVVLGRFLFVSKALAPRLVWQSDTDTRRDVFQIGVRLEMQYFSASNLQIMVEQA
jgi:hypothetical protein